MTIKRRVKFVYEYPPCMAQRGGSTFLAVKDDQYYTFSLPPQVEYKDLEFTQMKQEITLPADGNVWVVPETGKYTIFMRGGCGWASVYGGVYKPDRILGGVMGEEKQFVKNYKKGTQIQYAVGGHGNREKPYAGIGSVFDGEKALGGYEGFFPAPPKTAYKFEFDLAVINKELQFDGDVPPPGKDPVIIITMDGYKDQYDNWYDELPEEA